MYVPLAEQHRPAKRRKQRKQVVKSLDIISFRTFKMEITHFHHYEGRDIKTVAWETPSYTKFLKVNIQKSFNLNAHSGWDCQSKELPWYSTSAVLFCGLSVSIVGTDPWMKKKNPCSLSLSLIPKNPFRCENLWRVVKFWVWRLFVAAYNTNNTNNNNNNNNNNNIIIIIIIICIYNLFLYSSEFAMYWQINKCLGFLKPEYLNSTF